MSAPSPEWWGLKKTMRKTGKTAGKVDFYWHPPSTSSCQKPLRTFAEACTLAEEEGLRIPPLQHEWPGKDGSDENKVLRVPPPSKKATGASASSAKDTGSMGISEQAVRSPSLRGLSSAAQDAVVPVQQEEPPSTSASPRASAIPLKDIHPSENLIPLKDTLSSSLETAEVASRTLTSPSTADSTSAPALAPLQEQMTGALQAVPDAAGMRDDSKDRGAEKQDEPQVYSSAAVPGLASESGSKVPSLASASASPPLQDPLSASAPLPLRGPEECGHLQGFRFSQAVHGVLVPLVPKGQTASTTSVIAFLSRVVACTADGVELICK